jgi:hypothetical protein
MSLLDFFRKKPRALCGHIVPDNGVMTAFGETRNISIEPLANGKPADYCPDCLAKMAIRCAWCGKAIFPGDPITLYTPQGEFHLPGLAVKFSDKPLRVVGCLRESCCEIGASRNGFWMPPGKVQWRQSPMEMAIQTGMAIMVKDLANPGEEPTKHPA